MGERHHVGVKVDLRERHHVGVKVDLGERHHVGVKNIFSVAARNVTAVAIEIFSSYLPTYMEMN